jgi:carbonic anhydrase
MRKVSFILALIVAAALPLFAQTSTKPTSWDDLMNGNANFMKGGNLTTNVGKAPYGKQSPVITVLSCADSRVPPELVFNQSVGDLFVVRTAGNVASPFDIASMEYAIASPRNWTRLIVVLGHSSCGAVESALTATSSTGSNSLDALLDRIRESFVGISRPWSEANLKEATYANARYSAQYLVAHSAIIRGAVTRTTDRVQIIPAYYDLETGRVTRVP